MRQAAWISAMALATAIAPLGAGAEGSHVGWIETIACRAEWRGEDKRTPPVELDKNRDRLRFLYADESVRCTGPGSIRLQDHARSVEIISMPIKGAVNQRHHHSLGSKCRIISSSGTPPCRPMPAGWYTLQAQGAKEADQRAAENEKAVAAFGRPGGRPRDLTSVIFSPANNAVVRVDGFSIRWSARVSPGPMSLRLLDDNNVELWQKDEIDASTGQFDSEDLHQVLANERDKHYVGKLTLSLAATDSAEVEVRFSLLSTAKEQALDDDLGRCESKQGFMRNACRAYAFETRSLWNDLVAEYDDALTSGRTSTDLLIAAISYHRKIGDTDAVDRLTAQLPPGTKMPE